MTTDRRPSDHAARLAALDPGRSFLVQAPAGSGKTELLTDRILALLPTVRQPEEIVAITFTRKAASEMHARVLSKLHAASLPEPAGEQALRSWTLARAALAHDAKMGWRLLEHPARLSIRTIDSFCAGLVRGMPWLSELGGMPAITDDARPHYEAAANETLLLADRFDAVRRLLAHLDVDVAGARDALASMLGQRDQWLPLLRHGSDREAMQQSLADAIGEDLAALADAMPTGWAEILSDPASKAARHLAADGADTRLAALCDGCTDTQAVAHHLPRWKSVAHLLLTKDGDVRSAKGVNKNLGFPPKGEHKSVFTEWLSAADPSAAWIGLLHAARDIPSPLFTDEQWEVLGAQLVSLTLAVAQLRLRFAAKGEVDFIEIAQRAGQALGDADDPGELLLKLDASIRHLLIDEFQDTSQTQIDLLRTLTAGWQKNDGRTLFLVGDPMQSIYRFRKAEVGLFLQVRDQGLGELQPEFLRLSDNFRSQAGVVEWVNHRFAALMPPRDDAASGAIAYTASNAYHGALEAPAVQFHPVWSRPSADPDADEEEAAAIVIELIGQARAGAAPGKAPSIAILVRARSHVSGLAKRLAQARIASRAVELVPLARRPVVADLVQLARALSHPADRMAWLSVLRSPYCGLTLNSLHALFGHDHATPVPVLLGRAAERRLDPDQAERIQRIAPILLDTRNVSGQAPLAAWLESLWRRLGGPALYPGASVEKDAESFFTLVETIAPYGQLDPASLDAGVDRLFASPDASSDDAIEIMTMHKSKGLQFDTVILYGLHRQPRGDQAPLVRFEQSGGRVLFGPIKRRADTEADPVSRYLGMRERQRAAYETDRLLYVAATRAKHHLHLLARVSLDEATGQPRQPGAGSLLARLWPGLTLTPPALPPEETDPAHQDAPAKTGGPLTRVTLDALRARGVRPASSDTAVAAHPARSAAWQTEPAYDAAIGTLTHAWLARIGQDGPGAWNASLLAARGDQIERQLARAGVPAAQCGRAAQAVLQTLTATLSNERGRWLLAQSGARREWPLIDAGGRVSVIDLALSTEAGWLIVDYKTGVPHPGESPAQFEQRMRLRHGDQLARYCEQVTALDRRPARAALYFPRADAWIDL